MAYSFLLVSRIVGQVGEHVVGRVLYPVVLYKHGRVVGHLFAI